MGINKVQYGNTTLIDLTSDTVQADKLMQGYTAHDRTGALITGTASGGGTAAISVVDTIDPNAGGTIRTITALDISDTTATASDVAQGKYFYTAGGTKTAGTASGGGGTSNFVQGTFTGTTEGAAMNVNIPYTGSGYPISLMIFPTEGADNRRTGEYGLKIQSGACAMFSAVKTDTGVSPLYDGESQDLFVGFSRYKNSSTTATIYNYTSGNIYLLDAYSNASNGSMTIARIKSPTLMSVYIASASLGSYGFMDNISYTYQIVYSS